MIQKGIFKKIISGILATALLTTQLTVGFAGFEEKATVDRDKKEIIVKYKDDIKDTDTKNKVKEKLKLEKLDTKKKIKKLKVDVLELDEQSDINQVINELRSNPNVEYAQLNYKLYSTAATTVNMPKDPQFNMQWALNNSGQAVNGQTGTKGVDINILKAWPITSGNANTVVGVLDTGIDIFHSDLKNNIYINTREIPGNGKDDDGNGYIDDTAGWDFVNNDRSVYDSELSDKHGTYISGIIAANSNDEGVCGVAPNVKLLPLKFMDGNGGYTSDAIEAIDYAEKMGVKIINCSWGTKEFNPALKDAMEDSDILFVCAAGNEGSTGVIYPAGFGSSNIVSVTAIDSKGNLAGFANYGSSVNIAAPGVNILTTGSGNKYELVNGTSFAASFVTGTAALVKSYRSSIKVEEIKAVLLNNCLKANNLKDKMTSGGRLDSYTALNSFSENLKKIEEQKEKLKKDAGSVKVNKDVVNVLKSNKKYKDYSQKEKKLICEHYELKDSTLTEYSKKGYSLSDTINLAIITDKYGFTIAEVESLLKTYKKVLDLNKELVRYNSFKEREKLNEAYIKEVKGLILEGYKIDKISSAYRVSKALDVKIKDIISKGTDNKKLLEQLSDRYGNKDIKNLTKAIEAYNLDLQWVVDYLNKNSLTINEFLLKIAKPSTDDKSPDADNQTKVNAMQDAQPEVKYDKYITAPFSYKKNSNENVNLNTGSLNYEFTDLALPGKNGLNLNIASVYNSQDAALYDTYVKYQSTTNTYITVVYVVWGGISAYEYFNDTTYGTYSSSRSTANSRIGTYLSYGEASSAESSWESKDYWSNISDNFDVFYDYDAYITEELALVTEYSTSYSNETRPDTYTEIHNNLGTGWSFGFTSIENDEGYKYLHLANGSTYKINITPQTDDSNLEKYTLKDIKLENDNASFSIGNVSSSHVLIHKDGKREYFANDGRLLGIQDRFNNTIKFEHTTTINGHPVISKITDTMGRVINISYNNTPTGKSVVISLPDSSTIQYLLEPIEGCAGEYKLVKKIDQMGRETTFNYSIQTGGFTYLDKTNRSQVNRYANLTEVHYPTAAYTKYSYEMTTGNLGNQGSYDFYRVSTREEIQNAKSYNKQTYTYSGNYTGYPTCSDPGNLLNTFTYNTTVTDSENVQHRYYFEYRHLQTKEEVKDNTSALMKVNEYEYDPNKLPAKITRKTYNKSGQFIQTTENFEYDAFADLLNYWDSQAEGNKADTEHKTSFNYDSTYHYVKTKTYKRNATNSITEEYTPYAGDARKIEWFRVKENGVLKKQVQYIYDNYGNIIEERNYKDGWSSYISTLYSYANSNPELSTDFNGGYLTRKCVIDVKDADGNLVSPRAGNAAGIVDQNYKYDWYGNLKESQDANGNITSYEYDKLGRLLTEKHNADNTFKQLSYVTNANENSVTVTDENMNTPAYSSYGNKTKYLFDGLGNLTTKQIFAKNPATNVAEFVSVNQYEYDLKCRLDWEKNLVNGSLTDYSYDVLGRLLKKETLDGSNKLLYKESYLYEDGFSGIYLLKVTKTVEGELNSPSIVTTSYLDKYGRIRQQGRVHNCVEYFDTFKYDYVGNKTEEKTARANSQGWSQPYTAKYEYNYASQLEKTFNINNDYTTKEYDALGRVIKVYDIKGNKSPARYFSSYSYDNLGRVIQENIPFEDVNGTIVYSIKKHYYDGNGNVVLEKVTDNKPSYSTAFSQIGFDYDARNMLAKVTTYNDGIPENYTQYYYDASGNRLRMYVGLKKSLHIVGLDNVSDTGDNSYSVTKYEYDSTGKLTKMTDPMGKSESYTYDLTGVLKRKVDKSGNISTMTYDGLDRLLTNIVTNPNDPSTNVSYTYSYYLTGNKATMSGDGTNTIYKYDDLGRLIKEEVSNNISKEYDYDGNNNRKLFVVKQGTTIKINTAYVYDNLDRLSYVYENNQLAATYGYDENGNRSSLTYPNGITVEYQYNLANKLKKLTNKKGISILSQFDYTYYLDGNQSGKHDSRYGTTSYMYDDLGRLTGVSESDGDYRGYGYDDSNNRNWMTENGTDYKTYIDLQCKYDGLDRLKNATTPQHTLTYVYNADGLRLKKTVNGAETNFVLDGGNVVMENDTVYVRGADLICSQKNGVRTYYLHDGHGDVVQLTDASGNVIKNYEYDEFGNEKNIDASDINPFRYCGEYFDKETGLYYLRARYYDPTVGRFITEDSYEGQVTDPESLNLYTYCANNPILYIDPSGHMNYFTQTDSLINGIGSGIGDSINGILNSPWTLITIGKALVSGEISVSELVAAGLEGIVSDYTYVINHAGVLEPEVWSKYSDQDVHEFGKHAGGIISDILLALAGAGATKLVKVLSKTDSGAKIVKALERMSKAEFGVCFTGETLIKIEDGHKQIQDIKAGDKVYAENVETGEKGYKSVKQIFINDAYTLLNISVKDTVIKTTFSHPFYVIGKGWVEAKDLKIGDILKLANGETTQIKALEVEELVTPVKVYNFEVEDWHTYYVSGNDVLVHNTGSNPCAATRMTTKQATTAAKQLGYEPTNYVTKSGEKVFYNKKTKTYISQDVGSGNGMGSHNGGVWKAAKSPEALNSKETRLGTYDANLNRIGD